MDRFSRSWPRVQPLYRIYVIRDDGAIAYASRAHTERLPSDVDEFVRQFTAAWSEAAPREQRRITAGGCELRIFPLLGSGFRAIGVTISRLRVRAGESLL